MHDLQTIQFLNSAPQLAEQRAERMARDTARRSAAGDLHDCILSEMQAMALAETVHQRDAAYRAARPMLAALYDLAVKGGDK